MTWPVGLPLGTVTFGKAAVMQSGENLPMRVTVDVVLSTTAPSKVLTYRPTGSPLPGITTLFSSDEGTDEHSLQLPLCDTEDMGYGDGTALVLDATHEYTHVYRARIEYLSPDLATVYSALTTTKNFVLTADSPTGDIDDMLLIPSASTSFGVPVYVPDTWSAQVDAAAASAAAAEAALVDSEAFVSDTVTTGIEDPDSDIATALSASYAPTLGKPVEYLNQWDNFFGGYGWKSGQLSTETTTTSSVSGGATVIPVTSASGISADVLLVLGGKVHRVVSVASLNVTVTPALASGLANGAPVAPLFANVNHLYDTEGWAAWATWVIDQLDEDPGSGKVVFLLDSWGAQGATQITAALAAKYPAATAVVPTGNSGYTSQQLLAAFAAQVPSDAFYVVTNEGPGVNDVIGGLSPAVTASTTEMFVAACRAIGARPVVTGMVPMQNYPARAAEQQSTSEAQFAYPEFYPYVPASAVDARGVPSRKVNDASIGLGPNALANNTSGDSNVGLGFSALYSNTTGTGNLGIGASAGQNVTTGNTNVLIGQYAGFAPDGNSANGITTANSCVFIGAQSGFPNTTQAIGCVAIGYNAIAGGGGLAGAIGYGTRAADYGAWAIGTDSAATGATSTAQDEMVLGTPLHTVRVKGWLRLDKGQTTVGAAGAASALPATPTKYLSVKDSTGTEYVLPVYAKA